MLGIADEMPLQLSRSSGHGRGVWQRIKEGKGKLGALFICVVSLGTSVHHCTRHFPHCVTRCLTQITQGWKKDFFWFKGVVQQDGDFSQEPEAAGHILSTTRKEPVDCWYSACILLIQPCLSGIHIWGDSSWLC